MKRKNMGKTLLSLLLITILLTPFSTAKASSSTPAPFVKTSVQITINSKKESIVSGRTFLLELFNLSSTNTVQYKSSNTTVATVTSNGLITGMKPGTATIKVTVKNGRKKIKTLKCQITVGPPAFSVLLARRTVTLNIGENKILRTYTKPKSSVEKPTFISSNPNVAKVNSKGVVTALAVGSATITASIENKKTDTCLITVTALEEDVELTD